MVKWLVVAFFIFPSVYFANELEFAQCPVLNGYSSNCNTPCKIVAEGEKWDYFFLADWLYWKPFSEGYEFALINQQNFINSTGNRFFVNQKTVDLQFNFCSNYRLIGGAFLPGTQKHVILKFIHVQDSTSGSKVAYGAIPVSDPGILGTQLYRTWTLGSDTFSNPGLASANKTIRYLAGDIEFGKIVWDQEILSLCMQIGVRAVDLKNELRIHFNGSSLTPNYTLSGLSDMEIKNKFTGAGVRVGASMDFKLYGNFFWSNEFDGSLVLGKFKTKQRELFNDPISLVNPPPNPPVPVTAMSSLNQLSLKPNIQLSTSLGYAFTGYKHEISLKVGYELDYWLNMNQLTRFASEGTEGVLGEFFYVREKGDVYFHGIFGEAGISF
jgi:hypothetical protein